MTWLDTLKGKWINFALNRISNKLHWTYPITSVSISRFGSLYVSGKLHTYSSPKPTCSLRERFKESRPAKNNPLRADDATAAVPSHLNQPGHSIADMELILVELQTTLRMSLRKAREAYLIERGKTLSPDGLNRRNEHWTVSVSIFIG